MAFIYIQDGQRYEDDFHFRYVNGFRPAPELKIPTKEKETWVASGESEDQRNLQTRNTLDSLGRLGRRPGWCK